MYRRTYFSLAEVAHAGSEIPPFLPKDGLKLPILLRLTMTWRELLGYFRTMSALLSYHEAFPRDLRAEEDLRFLEEDLVAANESSGMLFYDLCILRRFTVSN